MRGKLITIIGGGLLILSLLPWSVNQTPRAQAASLWYVATTGNDGNSCQDAANACRTVGAAINKATSGDTILIGAGLYFENLIINKQLTLQGAGQGSTILDGNTVNRVVEITSEASVALRDLTIRGGKAEFGGGLFNQGSLTLKNCEITNNEAVAKSLLSTPPPTQGPGGHSASYGGGLYNAGATIINNCSVTGNKAIGGKGNGGGIYNNGILTITNSYLGMNVAQNGGNGGGIYSANILFLDHTIISENTAGVYGGGIYLERALGVFQSKLEMLSTSISNNIANYRGGGIVGVVANISIVTSTISNNTGGGIWFSSGSGIISNSTIHNNSTIGEGGGLSIHTWTYITVVNSTISQNSAVNGGGVWAYANGGSTSAVTLLNSSLISNTAANGSGIYATAGGVMTHSVQVTLNNSLIASAPPGGNCFISAVNSSAVIISNGHNLESQNTCGFTSGGDLPNTSPLVGPLQNNGGPTFFHALLPGSPAIDAGDNAVCNAAPVNGQDQIGTVRPQNTTCDIGAFEFVSSSTVITPSVSGSLTTTVNLSTTLAFPADATTQPVTVTVELTTTYPITNGLAVLGKTFSVEGVNANGQPQSSLLKPYTTTVEYSAPQVLGLKESSLKLYYWNPGNNTWVAIPTSVNLLTNTLTASTSRLAAFGVFGESVPIFDLYLPLIRRSNN